MGSSTKELFMWALNNGVRLRGLTTKLFAKSGRGVMTTRHINANDVLLSVPRRFLITFDTVLGEFKWMLKERSVCLVAKDLFIVFLVVERRKKTKSAFYIYLNSVPKEYTTPCCISQDEVDFLPYFVVEQMNKQNAIIKEHFDRLDKTIQRYTEKFSMFRKQELDLNEVTWAWNVVNTRSVYFSSRDLVCSQDTFPKLKEVDFALAPLLDMLNHKSEAKVDAKFNPSIDCYEIRTFDSYKPKQEVYINYGCHGNRTLYFEYGFILPDNVHAMCPIERRVFLKHFTLSDEEEEDELLNMGVSLQHMICTPDGSFDWSFITAAHILTNKSTRKMPEKCPRQMCLIYQRTLDLLHEMLFYYCSYIKTLSLRGSGPLNQLKFLIHSELNILKKTKENWISVCQIT